MNKEYFLSELQHSKEINIIGPFMNDNDLNFNTINSPTLFIDGGSQYIEKLPKISHYICVGDGDSSSGQMDILLPCEKNVSDLGFALSLIPQNIEMINLRGFLGGRKDHELCNLGEINQFLSTRSTITHVRWSNKMQSYSSGKINFDHQGTFSILSLYENTISINGLVKYPLEVTKVAPLSSICLSNIASGAFSVNSDHPFTIYFATQSQLE